MSEKLILRMSSQPTNPIPWLVWSDSDHQVIASGELQNQSELPSLAHYAQGRKITVLANSADVRLYRHFMDNKPNRQLLKALPFMLEDELAEDIDSLHFAIESSGYDKQTEQHFVNLAIVNKAALTAWLSVLSDAGLSVKLMLPEVLCLPPETESENTVFSAVEFANGWLVREGYWQGQFVESDWLNFYFQQLSSSSGEAQTTVIEHYSPLPQNGEGISDLVGLDFVTKEPELPLLLLAKYAESSKWNLLQGEFMPKKPVSKNWKIWRPAAALAVFVLVIEFGFMAARWHQNEQQLVIAKQQLVTSYKRAFPKEKLRINLLKKQLTRKVAQATGGQKAGSTFGFLAMINQLTPVFAQFKDVKSEDIRFDGRRSELRLNAQASSFQQFEAFKTAIEKLGLEVTQGAIKNEGSLVTGSLNIKEAS